MSLDAQRSTEKPTRHAAILTALRAHTLRFDLYWITNGDLMQPHAGGGDWRRRIHELRERGHVIIMRRDALYAHKTYWAWLGVENESSAAHVYETLPHRPNDPPLQKAWRTLIAPDVYRYATSDGLWCIVRETRTAGGGTMLVLNESPSTV